MMNCGNPSTLDTNMLVRLRRDRYIWPTPVEK